MTVFLFFVAVISVSLEDIHNIIEERKRKRDVVCWSWNEEA